ncbi:MAG: hypothetical protein U0797_00940 [Gemmataceae bacterium]
MTETTQMTCSERFSAIVRGLRSNDPDERIAAIRSLGAPEGWAGHERVAAVAALTDLLSDKRTDTYVYGFRQDDEYEPASRVCDEAARVLFLFLASPRDDGDFLNAIEVR